MTAASKNGAFDIGGRVVWITGIASELGHGVAMLFHAEGANVVGTDSSLPPDRREYFTLSCDLTRPGTISRVLAACAKRGGIDALVNCSCVPRAHDALNVDDQSWHDGFDTILKGAFLSSQAAAKAMIEAGCKGSIVNVGSIDADIYLPDAALSSVAHGGLNAMTRAIALALAPHGIRVNVIASTVATEDGRRFATPLGESNPSSHVPPVALFLVSDAAAFVTGSVLPVDGGRLASV